MLTSFLGNSGSEFLKLFGSGSRFESVTRGVIDFRDLLYYVSIAGVFLCLNVFSLESFRWSSVVKNKAHFRWRLLTVLVIANVCLMNVWAHHIHWLRWDLTKGNIYSISNATHRYLEQLQEPLLIRGYFSAKTHPLLAPLIPQLKDLILEYKIAGRGNVQVEFIDPLENPELEKEAGQKFGIKPESFSVSDKYQDALVNSYFNILIQYGDQHEVLSFRDLIDIKVNKQTDVSVKLRNPEYDITKSIKKVLYEFQSAGDIFASIKTPVSFTGYFSNEHRLPSALVSITKDLTPLLEELQKVSGGKFLFTIVDPDKNKGVIAKEIGEKYGFLPMQVSLLEPDRFYFYMMVESDGRVFQIPLSQALNKEGLRQSFEAVFKRFSTGYLKTVGLVAPKIISPYLSQFGGPSGKSRHFDQLRNGLNKTLSVKEVNLKDGVVPEDVDVLLVLSPENMEDKELFAIDQFLMKGATVIFSTSPFEASLERSLLSASKTSSGLSDWFKNNGIVIEETMVLDPQHSYLDIPVQRNLGGYIIQEIKRVNYPYFVDIRFEEENSHSLTVGLPNIMMNWASPIQIDSLKNASRNVIALLKSSKDSWVSDSTAILPDFRAYGRFGFSPKDDTHASLLAVMVEGKFNSFFKGKESPLLEKESDKDGKNKKDKAPPIIGVIQKSLSSARLVLFSSNEFLTDETQRLSFNVGQSDYAFSLQLIQNTIDWVLEDKALLTLRGHSYFSATLSNASKKSHIFWETLNYICAVFGLLITFIVYRFIRKRSRRRYHELFQRGDTL